MYRIISGLVNGIVVVEAAKSGTVAAELALSEGRDIFAVPGSVLPSKVEVQCFN